MEEKGVLRKQIKKRLEEHSSIERQRKSDDIFNKVLALPQWKQASCIGITIARDFEVETRNLIEWAWKEGKSVCVPKCVPETREMFFYCTISFEQLEKGYSNLYEPNIDITEKIHRDRVDCLIVPGIAFTECGERLGFGGGYYDRFLAKYKGAVVALSFECQILPHLPTNHYDKKVAKIVTEKRIIENDR